MSKRAVLLICCLAAVVLLAGGYFIIKAVMADVQPAEPMVLFETEALTELEYTFEGEKLGFKKTGEGWKYSGDEDFPLNTAYLRDIENVLKSVEASAKIDGDAAEFGLDSPAVTIEAKSANGDFSCALGDRNDTSNVVYMSFEGGIYAVDDGFSNIFSHSLKEMAVRTAVLNVQPSQVKKAVFTNADGVIELVQTDEIWRMNGERADLAAVKELISSVAGLSFESCAAYKPTADELDRLIPPETAVKAELQYEGGEMTFLMGGGTDEARYVYIDGMDIIYTAKPDVPNSIAALSAEQLYSRDVFPEKYSDFDEMRLTVGGATAEVDLSKTEGAAWDFFYALSNLRAEGFAETATEGALELSATFIQADSEVCNLALVKYSEDHYAVYGYSERVQLIGKRGAEELLRLAELAVGE